MACGSCAVEVTKRLSAFMFILLKRRKAGSNGNNFDDFKNNSSGMSVPHNNNGEWM